MEPLTIGLIISGILDAIGSIGSGIMSAQAQKQQNEYNQQQYEDWKAYNSPEAQMQRLEDAGLNKYLVSAVNNTLSSPFQAGAVDYSGAFKGAADTARDTMTNAIQLRQKELNQKKLDISLLDYDLRYELAQQAMEKGRIDIAIALLNEESTQLGLQWLKDTYDERAKTPQLQNEQLQENIKNLAERTNLTAAQKEMVQKQFIYYDNYVKSQIAKNYSDIDYKQAFIKYLNDRLDQDKHEFVIERSTLSAWQEAQVDNFLTKNGIAEDYYNLEEKYKIWSVVFQSFNALSNIFMP